MNISNKVAVITGAASGIGRAVAHKLAEKGVKALCLVDQSENVLRVARSINERYEGPVAEGLIGDVNDGACRRKAFDLIQNRYGTACICVPAAGVTRDQLSVRIDKETGRAQVYPLDKFHLVVNVNLIAPIYWALEMVSRIAEERAGKGQRRWTPEEGVQGTIIFIGSVSSQGNPGQIAYATAKAGIEGAAATLSKEAIYYGVRSAVIHPGYTDTPMVRALGEDYIREHILPHTQLQRLIQPEEIADAICFLISNPAVSGELWADAGWHPTA
jgi:3-oxoacyl-[acyl-carrier protein] reductase